MTTTVSHEEQTSMDEYIVPDRNLQTLLDDRMKLRETKLAANREFEASREAVEEALNDLTIGQLSINAWLRQDSANRKVRCGPHVISLRETDAITVEAHTRDAAERRVYTHDPGE